MTKMLYLQLILKDCTLSLLILRTDILRLIIAMCKQVSILHKHILWNCQRYLLCLGRTVSMARFASEAELETFLGRLLSICVHFARQLANATKPLLLSCGLPEVYIDDIMPTLQSHS